MDEDKQMWLFPEMQKSGEFEGIKPEVSDFKLNVDRDTWDLLQKWKVRVVLNGIIIERPYSVVADREPDEILFSDSAVSRVILKKLDEHTVNMDLYFNDGKFSHDQLILHENGKVEHVWGQHTEHPKK